MFFMIWVAMIFSLVGMAAALDVAGPENDDGNIEIAKTITSIVHRMTAFLSSGGSDSQSVEGMLLKEVKALRAASQQDSANSKSTTEKLLAEVAALRDEVRGYAKGVSKTHQQ